MTEQTQLGIQNSKRSPTKVRKLSPEELEIPTGSEDSESEKDAWEELRSKAVEAASESGGGAAVRTDKGRIVHSTKLDGGVSRDIHALELAVWTAYKHNKSPISDVAIVNENREHPCGRCLQVVADYGLDSVKIQIINGNEVNEFHLFDLINIQ